MHPAGAGFFICRTHENFPQPTPCQFIKLRYDGFLNLNKDGKMKVKTKTPDRFVVGFNRRELMIVNNCLHEACHGLIMDRFLPAHQQLGMMLRSFSSIMEAHDFFKLRPVRA
jgi:hypothetical protein